MADQEKIKIDYAENIDDYIKPKNSLLEIVKNESAIDYLVKKLKTFPNYEELRIDSEFVLFALKILKQMVTKKDSINKEDIIVKVFVILFNINIAEQETLKKIIQFICTHKLVHKIRKSKKLRREIYKFVSSRLFF